MGIAAENHRAAHDAFNKRDWDALKSMCAEDLVYEDKPRDLTMKGPGEWVDWVRGWPTAFSDAVPDDPDYMGSDEWSIARFTARGKHDGPLGPFEPRGGQLETPFCELIHWNADGKMDRGEIYYDQMTMLTQLGLIEAPPAG